PLGEALEVGEGGGQDRHVRISVAHEAAEIRTDVSDRRCWCSATYRPAVRCRWRSRISWSFSGNSLIARDSSMVCVASSVLLSCSAYSLNVTAASSWLIRSLAFFGGTK